MSEKKSDKEGQRQPATLETERDPKNPNKRVLFLVPKKERGHV